MPATFTDQIRIVPGGFEATMGALEKLVPDLKVALKDTVNKSMDYAQELAVSLILKRYHISKPDLLSQSSRHGRWRFKVKKATDENPMGKLEVVGTRMPVMRFSVNPSDVPNQLGVRVADRQPVTIRIVKWGGAQAGKPNVFLAKMPKSGHIGVYRRKYPNPGGPRRMRPDGQMTQLPITEEYMLSVPEMLQGKKLRKKFDDELFKYVGKEMKEELKRVSGAQWARVRRKLSKM